MTDAAPFLGTWASEGVPPRSTFLFTWTLQQGRLSGRMVISASDPATEQRARDTGLPARLEQTFDEVTVDGRRLLFRMNARQGKNPFFSEFRLLDDNSAVMGAAVDRLPDEYRHLVSERSIQGHRVSFVRHAPPEPEAG